MITKFYKTASTTEPISSSHPSVKPPHLKPLSSTQPKANLPLPMPFPFPNIPASKPLSTCPVSKTSPDTARKTLINPHLKIPQTLPPIDLPPPDSQPLDTYRSPDDLLFRQPLPILHDSKDLDVFTLHIPKQTDIDAFLKVLKSKITKSYELPLSAIHVQHEYANSPAFRNIYAYITKGLLPKDRRTQRMILANAENFIVANGLLFKLQHTKRNRLDTLQCLLVIPEKFENVIFHMFHDSLLGAHYGPLNTYYTIKERYFMHNMFEKLNRYISSCDACQKQKTKKTKQPAFHPRIPLSYNPMAYLSADIKYMPKGIYGYEFLLLTVCEITGFAIAIPLIKHDAVSIAHALLDRVVLVFGPPKTLIVDEDRALSSKVMHYILDALNIQIKFVSPSNHGSLKTERYIQTINNLITRHLKDKGREWPLYVTSCCYAMNTFVSTSTGFSPYELVFLKKPPDILNLYFQPLDTIAKGYEEYCIKMRSKLDNISNFILELKTFQQEWQAQENHFQNSEVELFQEGQLVYLLAPSAASLQTKTRKCRADYVGPLVINKILDDTHYILNDLQGRILVGVFHINRLKKATIRTPSGIVSTYSELHDTFTHLKDSDKATPQPLPDIPPAAMLQSLQALNLHKKTPVLACNCSPLKCTCVDF